METNGLSVRMTSLILEEEMVRSHWCQFHEDEKEIRSQAGAPSKMIIFAENNTKREITRKKGMKMFRYLG